MILIIILVVLGVVVALIYNSIISNSNTVMNAYSNIDVLLKRRYDIIPNIIETVKGYNAYEGSTLESVTQMRISAMSAIASLNPMEKSSQEQKLSQGISSIMAVAENYPDLKSSSQFQELQKQLSILESDIQNARQKYNDSVRHYNTGIQHFPANILVPFFGFRLAEYFGAESSERENVKVSF
jgi:LemA protein